MQKIIQQTIHKYWEQELTQEELIQNISQEAALNKENLRELFDEVIQNKSADGVEYGLTILYIFEENNEYIDIIHQLLLEPWHRSYEEIAHDLQERRLAESIPFLREAMQKKYDYLESYGTGTRQFVNQCGHVLKSIGTKEAIEVIKELSQSTDPIIKDEMFYRLSKIEGKNDYKRSY